MNKMKTQIINFPFYLWILAIYPIIYLYSNNIGQVIDSEVISISLISLIVTTTLFLFNRILIKQTHKTAFMLSIILLLFFMSGHIYEMLGLEETLLLPWALFILGFMITIIMLFIIKYNDKSTQFFISISPTLNLIVVALLILPSFTIAQQYSTSLDTTSIVDDNDNVDLTSIPAPINDSQKYPDIYYIIPDAYPSNIWLEEEMGYDNSSFTNELENRGFIVPNQSQSAYGFTLLSIPSSLNMRLYDTNDSSPQLANFDYLRLRVNA